MDRQCSKHQDVAPHASSGDSISTCMEYDLRHLGQSFKLPARLPAELNVDESILGGLEDFSRTTTTPIDQRFIYSSADLKFVYSPGGRSAIDSAYGSSGSTIHNIRSWTLPRSDGECMNSISTKDDFMRHSHHTHGRSVTASRQQSPNGETDREAGGTYVGGRKNK